MFDQDSFNYNGRTKLPYPQQNVCAMVGCRVGSKCYLRSTFGRAGQIRFQKPTTAQTQTLWAILFGQMRLRILTILLLLTLTNAFGQIDVELYFKSACTDTTYKLEYSLFDKVNKGEYINSVDNKVTVPRTSIYHLYISMVKGDYVHSFDHDIIINDKLVDTLLIPRITFTTGSELHTKFWSYFNCEKACNGKETDFYGNGNKRTEGEFIDGKPKWMIEYRADGIKKYEYWYKPGNYFPDRLNKYNDNGQLDEYEIKEFKKGKTITLTYDSKDKLLDRQVQKY